MKLLILLAGITLFSFPKDKVYLCVSNSAKVYHVDRDCRGLGSCTHKVISVSSSAAVNEYGRRACKVCD